MKKSILGLDVEISDWNPKMKVVAIILSVITVISAAMTVFLKITVPGLTPIAFGTVLLLLGTREFNYYFKVKRSGISLVLGIIMTVLFVVDLYIGANQIITSLWEVVVK